MLSRVADAVHWMARYMERAESIARFIDVTQALTLDLPGDHDNQWHSLVSATGDDAVYSERHDGFERAEVMRFLVFDRSYENSMCSCIAAARENARSIRESISSDVWENLNRAYRFVRQAEQDAEQIMADPEAFLQRIKAFCHQFDGSSQVTMTHNDAWRFLQLGRLLERADKTSRILDVKILMLRDDERYAIAAEEDLHWSASLQSVSGLEMYRQQYGQLDPKKVLQFLLFDPQFPRAIRYCVQSAETILRRIDVGRSVPHPRNAVERRLGRLRAELEFADVEEVIEKGLHRWVDDFQAKLNRVGMAMHQNFFELGPTAGQRQSQSAGRQRQSQSSA